MKLKPCLVLICGPRFSGKTTLALELSAELQIRCAIDEDDWKDNILKDLDNRPAGETAVLTLDRLATVASYLTAFCGAPVIASFEAGRKSARENLYYAMEQVNMEVLTIYLECPSHVRLLRDPSPRAKHKTGFQAPHNADLRLDTSKTSIQGCLQEITRLLEELNFITT